MNKKKLYGATVAMAAGLAIALAGCSGSGGSGGKSSADSITVWLMQGTLTPESEKALKAQFTKETGATLKVEIQQWGDIVTKLTTALSSNTTPDAVQLGNTQVPLFSENGALLDLTSYKKDLSGGDDWLSALAGPATNKDKLYAVPLSASSQGIIYNKNMWQAAGVTSVPKTWAELTAALDKVKASNTAADFSPLYLAGGNWYNALSWVYDFGGTLATEKGGKWKAGFSSPESIAGLEAFKEFQNSYSTPSSRSALYDQPLAYEVLSTEKTSAVMAWMYNSNAVIENNPALKDVLGSFALPSMTKSGETAPIFLGGSDIAIPAKSKNQELAIKYLKIFTSHDFQLNELVKRGQQIPISTQLIDEVVPTLTDFEKPFYAAAGNSLSTPATAGWVTIESDNSAQDFFIKVASGSGTIPDAAAAFDKHLDQALNATDK